MCTLARGSLVRQTIISLHAEKTDEKIKKLVKNAALDDWSSDCRFFVIPETIAGQIIFSKPLLLVFQQSTSRFCLSSTGKAHVIDDAVVHNFFAHAKLSGFEVTASVHAAQRPRRSCVVQ